VRPRLISEDQLLDLALGTFAELGFEGTSMRDLGRRLGMSHNMVQARYGSKDRLWHAAVDHGFHNLGVEIWDVGGPRLTDDVEMLRNAMIRYVSTVVENPSLQRIIQQESSRPGPRFEYMFTRSLEPTQRDADRVLKRLQSAGRIRAGGASTVFYFLVTYGLGAIGTFPDLTSRLGDPQLSPSQAARLAVDVIVNGLIHRSDGA
jgi:TetR/AcrR family transcriptional regulator